MTQKPPLVSIVLPTYNRAEWLPRALGSIFAQTYSNWELIVWDDGSQDKTRDIVESCAEARICYRYGENFGVSYARNRAMELARGEYLAFLDSDDTWAAGKLEDQVNVMSAHPEIGLLFSDFANVSLNGSSWTVFEHYTHAMNLMDVDRREGRLAIIRAGIPGCLAIENFIATDTVMVRQKLLQQFGGFNESLRSMEDFELWWRMGLGGVCFAYLRDVHLTRYKLVEALSGPSIATFENRLRSLDLCSRETRLRARNELLVYLDESYRNTWQHMIRMYGKSGNRKGMLNAFVQSMRYGFRIGSIRLLLEAIITS